MAVEGRRDLLPQLLTQRHPCGRGQLPAIGKYWAAEDKAPWGIQGPAGGAREQIVKHKVKMQYMKEPVELILQKLKEKKFISHLRDMKIAFEHLCIILHF